MQMDKTQMRLFETLLFLVKVLLFAVPLYAVMYFQNVLLPLQEAVSANVVALLQLFGFDATRNGFLILADGMAFIVSEDCTGWKSMLFLTALICAVPAVAWKKRLAGIAVGIPAIYAGNLLRILLVTIVWSSHGLDAASAVHNYFWQAGLISLVLVIWVMWLVWTGKLKREKRKTLIKRPRKLIKPRRRGTRRKAPKRAGKR